MKIDAAGNLYVLDSGLLVRKISPAGVVSSIYSWLPIPNANSASAIAVNSAGAVSIGGYGYITNSSNTVQIGAKGRAGYVDGSASVAQFGSIDDLAYDNSGDLLIADGQNRAVRKLANGTVSTVAVFPAGSNNFTPRALAFDGQGNLYVAGGSPSSIQKLASDGTISLFAGDENTSVSYGGSVDGTGSTATFNQIGALAYSAGNLYVTDAGDDLVRVVSASGVVTTLGGEPGTKGSADGVGGTARFNQPIGIAADSTGHLYVADTLNTTIRLGTASTAPSIPFLTPPRASATEIALGLPLRLSAAAFGSGPISIQWLKNGVAIPGANAPIYTVSAAQSSDAGTYSAEAINSVGSIALGNLVVSVYTPPATQFLSRQFANGGTSLWGIAAGAGRLVAVGTGGGILASTDGTQWIHAPSPVTDWLVAVCYAQGKFVAVGDNGRILSSADGLAWSIIPTTATAQRLNNVLFAANQYVAVGEAGTVLTSPDAQTWTARNSGVSTWLRGLTYSSGLPGGQWIATGQSGVVISSADAVVWSRQQLGSSVAGQPDTLTDDLEAAVAQGGNSPYIVTIGQAGATAWGEYISGAAFGTNGGFWQWQFDTLATPTTQRLRGLASAAGALFAFGENGTIIAGPSIVGPYAILNAGTTANLNGGAFLGTSIYIVGDNETILQSTPLPANRLLNISTLGATSPASPLTGGFVISGSTPKQVLVRAAGPALTSFGVAQPLGDPALTVYGAQGNILQQNTGWQNQANSSAVAAAAAQVQAFPYGANSTDSALLITLNPGQYTASVASAGGGTGMSLLEAYDVDPATNSPSQVINISSRALVAPGQSLTAGFVIGGNATHRLLIRGIGPALANFGIGNSLLHPHLTLYGRQSRIYTSSDAWTSQFNSALIASEALTVGAFALSSPGNDAALIVTLDVGSWTATVTSGDGSAGTALVEIYDLPQ